MIISGEALKRIENITLTNYEAKKILEKNDIYSIENTLNASQLVEDLLFKYDELEQKLNEIKEYKEQYCDKYSFD